MTGPRPRRLVLVAGTGTDIGKSWVGARLLEHWRAGGLAVAARKLAQSYDEGSGPTDAEVLAAATGEDARGVCPPQRWYPVAMAPAMAAEVLGRPPFTVAELVGETAWDAGVDVGLVEGAGGVRSPQADDGDLLEVATLLAPDAVVLVADAGLGTIDAVRHAIDALGRVRIGAGEAGPRRLDVEVVLNRYDATSELHRRNLDWLRRRDGLAVTPVAGGALADLARRLAPTRPQA